MKDINKLLKTLTQKAAYQDINVESELNAVFEYYSTQIGKSIQPLNAVSAPFVYRLLTEYAQAVKKYFPEEIKMSDYLGETQMTMIML